MKKIALILLFSFISNFTDASTVVLPSRFKNSKVLTVDTTEYKKYVEQNKKLQEQLVLENKNWLDYSKSVDNQVKYNSEIQSKLLNDFNSAKLTISKQQTTISKQRFTILCQWIGIALFLFVLGVLFYTGILKIGILPFNL